MNYRDPPLLEALAQRYVIGTMSYRARRRFAQVLADNAEARERVRAWEERLAPLALSLPPVAPSELVWQRIAREIGPEPEARRVRRFGVAETAIIACLSVALVVTGLGWWQSASQPPQTVVERVPVPQPETAAVSVLADAGGSYWVARYYRDSARLDVDAQGSVEARTDRDYQLWTLQQDGTPVSLGLLPQAGSRTLRLEPAEREAIARSQTFAVSLEPVGGSPEAVPTGPVLYTGALFRPGI